MKTLFNMITLFALLITAQLSWSAGTSDNNFRVGKATGSDVEVRLGDGLLKWDDGTSKIQVSDDGVGFRAITDISANSATLIENTTVDTSVAANALTIDLKIADGTTDPVAGNPSKTSFRDVTAADGAFNILSVTGALTIVIPSGATLNHSDTTDGFVYVYQLDNVGAIELAVSSVVKDESSVQTSITIGTGSDDTDLYSTTGRSNVPIRLIARLKSNQTTAGTWAVDVIENTPGPQIFTDLTNSLNTKLNTPSGDPTIIRGSARITCDGSSAIQDQTGSWLASIGNISAGACLITLTDSVINKFIACQATQSLSTDPTQLFSFHTPVPASGTVTIDCDAASSGTDCTAYTVEIACDYRP